MSDRLASYVRTLWPLLLGHVAAVVVGLTLRLSGVQLDELVVFEALSLLLAAGVYALGRRLEESDRGWVRRVGRWLLSIGLDTGQPQYPQAAGRHRA